ncbi:hypothetical protein BJY52DRAFT_1420012 [Lactarius psammicola]|nr:hypothetical protein BJY52DRAFT_1420012 [Lactarius psammicola]
MAHHQVPPRADHLSVNPFPPLHQLHGHVQQHVANPHVAGDNQQAVHQDGVPQAAGNVVVPVEMQYPHHIDAPNYNPAHYHPPPPPYPEGPYVRMHQDVEVAQGVPVEARAYAPGAQENHDGLYGQGAQFPAADHPEAFYNVRPDPAPLADMPPVNGLRNLVGRYLDNPDTRINMVWIEPGPGGRFKAYTPRYQYLVMSRSYRTFSYKRKGATGGPAATLSEGSFEARGMICDEQEHEEEEKRSQAQARCPTSSSYASDAESRTKETDQHLYGNPPMEGFNHTTQTQARGQIDGGDVMAMKYQFLEMASKTFDFLSRRRQSNEL